MILLEPNKTGCDFFYSRVSTQSQEIDRQKLIIDQFIQRCGLQVPEDHIIFEKISGRKRIENRPVFKRLLKDGLRSGDRLIVTSGDRLSRELFHLLEIMKLLEDLGIELIILDMHIDKEHPMGAFLLNIMGAVYQLESDFASYRTKQGLEATRAKGTELGRKKGPTIPSEEFLAFFNSFDDPHEGVKKSMEKFDKTETTIRRWLNNNGVIIPRKKRES
jgi:DNA invertase Pin-like site-specific DNA recombinase